MIGKTNTIGGSMGKAFARIIISFPDGKSSCTDGTTTLQGTNNGFTVFNVPNAGTWTVTITNGAYTATKSFVVYQYSVLFSEMAYILPTGYKQVEYVDIGSGAAYTAVDISAANITRTDANVSASISVYYRGNITTYYDYLCGSYNNYIYSPLWQITPYADYRHDGEEAGISTGPSTGYNYTYTITISGNRIYGYISGHTSGSCNTSFSNNDMGTIIYMGVGRAVNGFTGSSTSNGFNGYIYSFTFSKSGTTYVDLLPCKNPAGVAGLWDKITQQFYQSVSSTAFIAGPEVSS